MTPFITSKSDASDEFDCDTSSNQSFSDSQTTELNTVTPLRVRFQSPHPKVLNPDTEYYGKEDCLVRWWSTEDLQKIRQKIKTLCARIRYHEKRQYYELTTAHRKITLILASDFSSLMKLPLSLPNQDLSIWCSYNDGRRGLERSASKVYACFRLNDILKTREAVLKEQLRQRREGANDPEMIAEVCKQASRRARSFAQFMAGADAQQVGKDGEKSFPQKRSKLSKLGQSSHTI